MKQARIAIAYKKILELYAIKGLGYKISGQLFLLKNKLQPYMDHQREQEIRLIEENNDGEMEEGKYRLTDENTKVINKGLAEIQEAEVDYTDPPTVIVLDDEKVITIGLTGELMDVLHGFVEFRMEGEE